MTTAAKVLVCSVCNDEFTAPAGAGRTSAICESCYQRYLNPPEQTDPNVCRLCPAILDQSTRLNAKHGGRLATFCDPCRKLHYRIVQVESKRQARSRG